MKSNAYVQPVFMGRCDVCREEGDPTSEFYAEKWVEQHNKDKH